jgi:predicted AAA+ superfamily ATPase
LYPLTFSEFLIFKGKNLRTPKNFSTKAKRKNEIECEKYSKLYREYLEFGGFPQVVLEEDVKQKRAMLSDIFNSYFQIDILTLNDFKKIEAFKKLIFLLMERSGSKIDISKIASLSGVSRDTIYSYLNLLQGSYFIHFIEPFSRNRDKEVSGTKKVYLCDTGILNHLSKVSEGALFENAVFNNLRQYGKINYYQRRTGSEIDFILNEKIAFEAKITGDERDVAKMEKIAQKIKIKQSFLITKNFLNNDKAICAYQI